MDIAMRPRVTKFGGMRRWRSKNQSLFYGDQMKKYLYLLLISSILLGGCSGTPRNSPNASNAVANASTKTNATPATEKADGDYVDSEDGTAKATPESGKANVQGKVLFNGEPAAGVEVKICQKFSRFMGDCSGDTFKTKTDASGEYLFSNVTAGVYEGLLVKVFETNSYIFATQGLGVSAAKYKFDADSTYFAPVTNLFKFDLKHQEPKANATVDGTDLKVKWEAYAGATYYKLNVNPAEYDSDSTISGERVEGNEYTVPKVLKPGKYSLTLSSYNANDVKLSELKERISFTVK
jgi:FlaG/FlaF family flagellin (archaellin)